MRELSIAQGSRRDVRQVLSVTISWIPFEDQQDSGTMRANDPTEVSPGRGTLTIAVCPHDAHHPLGLVSQ
ncbi:hypothetical protein JS756_32330 [Streptomyces actuosus]|uniref:Uncharacterized protein n=1 Tax=Streptomyces actuosus TaxID=1885 RepID=A0ABS2VZW4_STRAS|nr:hypothetical protein [Streptomyces actuosus]MBN0048697.1 hypothetical protein [Streptomyces actuosus]